MSNVNTYGLKMIGLRKACSETKDLQGPYSPLYIQLSYNRDTGKIYTDCHCSLGKNSWTVYHDPDIITVATIDRPVSMQWIADAIKEGLK